MNTEPSHRSLVWLLLSAVLLKGAYLVQYLGLPILDGPVFDSLAYLRQARALDSGVFHDASLVAYSPLYGYVLWLTGAAFDVSKIVALQLVLGCFNLVLLYQIAERLFDRRAALVGGTLYLTYGLLAFYETKVLAETFGLTLSLAALSILTQPGFVEGRLRVALGAGVVLGLAVLARSNLLLVAPLVPLSALLPWRLSRDTAPQDALWAARVRRALGCALGLSLVFAINGAWNYRNTGLFVPVILRSATASRASQVTWDGKLSAFSSRSDGDVGVFDVLHQAQARIAGIKPTHRDAGLDVLGVISGAPSKLVDTFRNVETDFQYGYYGERSELSVFVLLSGSFGAYLVLALVGVFALHRTGRLVTLWPLSSFVLGALATTVLFHPSSRYRLPMVIPMLLLSGYAVTWLWDQPRTRHWWLSTSCIALLCGYFTYGTLFYRLNDPAMWQLRMAESAIAGWDGDEAARRIARAQAIAGNEPHIQRRIAYLRAQFTHERVKAWKQRPRDAAAHVPESPR